MQNLIPHTHNRTDSPPVHFDDIDIFPEDAISDIADSADGTYSANEQSLINLQTATINSILAALRNKKIIDT